MHCSTLIYSFRPCVVAANALHEFTISFSCSKTSRHVVAFALPTHIFSVIKTAASLLFPLYMYTCSIAATRGNALHFSTYVLALLKHDIFLILQCLIMHASCIHIRACNPVHFYTTPPHLCALYPHSICVLLCISSRMSSTGPRTSCCCMRYKTTPDFTLFSHTK